MNEPIKTVLVEDTDGGRLVINIYYPQQIKDGYVVTDSSGTQNWRFRVIEERTI